MNTTQAPDRRAQTETERKVRHFEAAERKATEQPPRTDPALLAALVRIAEALEVIGDTLNDAKNGH